MLSINDLRKIAARSGARDIGNVEIDVILTFLLQLFTEKKITDHVAFKGGTMLRKMVFGPRGRLSTDLDFTCRTDIHLDNLMIMMLDALAQPYHGLAMFVSHRALPRMTFAAWGLVSMRGSSSGSRKRRCRGWRRDSRMAKGHTSPTIAKRFTSPNVKHAVVGALGRLLPADD
jgi:hypothetical protein